MSRVRILSVISKYISLKEVESYWKGNCPFHIDESFSFTVNPTKNVFYCFQCHVGGDVITFISKIKNCSPLEANDHILTHHQE